MNARKPVRILLSICIPSNASRECVATALKMCSFSDLQSYLLRPDRDVCTGDKGDTRVSCRQAMDQRCYLSQNIGPVVAGSARPAPPPLESCLPSKNLKQAKLIQNAFIMYSHPRCSTSDEKLSWSLETRMKLLEHAIGHLNSNEGVQHIT